MSYTDDIMPNKLIQLYAGVGSGKNYFINQLIKGYEDTLHSGEKAKLEPLTVLVITSRRSKVDELLTEDDLPADGKVGRWNEYHQVFDEEFKEVEPTGRYIQLEDEWGQSCTVFQRSVVCTNAFIEKYFQYRYRPRDRTTHLWELFDLIVIDEAHSLMLDASYQTAPFYVNELIREYLRRHRAAEDAPEHNRKPLCKNMILMTGSVEPMKKLSFTEEPHLIDRMDVCINVMPKNIHFMSEEDAKAQLIKQVEAGEKAIYFSNFTPRIDDFIKDTSIAPAVVAVSFSKKENRDRLAKDDPAAFDRMVRVEASIAENKQIPEDIHLWLTTSRNKEGINIENEDIPHLYVESHIQSDIIQMAGRIRAGVEHMYVIVDAQDNYSDEWKNEADFTRRHLATSITSADSIFDACNEYLETLCIRNSIVGLFNTREAALSAYDKKNSCSDIMECIDYFHKTFSYVRYSYIDNVFRFYKMHETSRQYQARMLRGFKAAVEEPQKLQCLFQRWFPTATVHPYVPSEEARSTAAIEFLTSMDFFNPARRFAQEEHDEMIGRLNQIYGTSLTSIASLLKKCVPYTMRRCSGTPGNKHYRLYRSVQLAQPDSPELISADAA